MTTATEKAMLAIAATDDTITDADALAGIQRMKGGTITDCADQLLTRAEVCRMLRITGNTATKWAKEGKIKRILLAGRRKSHGYSRNSVVALIEGRAA